MGTPAELPERIQTGSTAETKRKVPSKPASAGSMGQNGSSGLQTQSGSPQGTIRRIDGQAATGAKARAAMTDRNIVKTKHAVIKKQPGVDEATILSWLGSTEPAEPVVRAKSKQNSKPVSQPASDAAILSLIGDRLVERGISSFTRIGLDLKQGTITARGTVASKGERLLLLEILHKTPGIRQVNDGLTVARKGSTSSSFQLNDLLGSIPSFPSLPSGVFNINPLHAGAVLGCMILFGLFFWTRGPSRPVAVYPVKGRVVLEGEPVPNATVVLHPLGKSKLPGAIQPHATVSPDGGFAVGTFESNDGAPEGEFVATVYLIETKVVDGEQILGPNHLPAVYALPETSPLRVKITRETKEISLLELHKTDESSTFRN